jgi:hypothetical protein
MARFDSCKSSRRKRDGLLIGEKYRSSLGSVPTPATYCQLPDDKRNEEERDQSSDDKASGSKAEKGKGRGERTPVARGIVINELLFKDLCSSSPVDAKILCQIASDVLSPSVRHEPGQSELVHVSVDKPNVPDQTNESAPHQKGKGEEKRQREEREEGKDVRNAGLSSFPLVELDLALGVWPVEVVPVGGLEALGAGDGVEAVFDEEGRAVFL